MEIIVDKFGYCVMCHDKVMDVVGDKHFKLDNWSEQWVGLSDNTRMKLSMCTECKGMFGEKHYDEVMVSVLGGWENELKDSDWDEDRKKDYIKSYSKLRITRRLDNGTDN